MRAVVIAIALAGLVSLVLGMLVPGLLWLAALGAVLLVLGAAMFVIGLMTPRS